jgi:choline kinase
LITTRQQPGCGIINDLNAAQIPLHVVVLAAGRGSRLGAVGDATPKWLLPVGGRTIADRHLAGFAEAGDAVASVAVVTGHAAADIEAALAERDEAVAVIHNPEYAEINNWWSVLRALRELPDEGPVVIVNADLLVDPGVVAGFLRACAGGDSDALVAVDFARRLTDESMKVEQGEDGRLTRIGKVGLDAPVGEYIGMLMARGDALRAFRASLESFVGRDECVNEWYEGAVGRTAADGAAWHLWPVPSGDWVEIDDDADLHAAEAMAGAR